MNGTAASTCQTFDSEPPDPKTFMPKGKMRPLQVLDVSKLDHQLTPEEFYKHFGHEPVIVRGLYKDTSCFRDLDRQKVVAAMKGQTIWGWSRKTGQGSYVPSEEIFADLDKPLKEREWNVVDHPVSVDTFGQEVNPPSFLQENWFLGNTLDTDYYRLNITVSGANNWTPLHTDNNGMQGWMWLAYGKKEWQLFSPEQCQLLFDPMFKKFLDERKNDPRYANIGYSMGMSSKGPSTANGKRQGGRWPYAHLASGLEGVARGGDLLWFPPGWAHQVFTPEESFGIGGSVLNHYLAEEAASSVVTDRAHLFKSELDVRKLISIVAKMPGRMPDAEKNPEAAKAAQMRVDAALELLDDWDKREKEIVTGESSW